MKEIDKAILFFQQTLKEAFSMKVSKDEIQKKAGEALHSCLSRVPFLKIESIKRQTSKEPAGPDFLIKIASPGGEKHLLVETKANGQPRLGGGSGRRPTSIPLIRDPSPAPCILYGTGKSRPSAPAAARLWLLNGGPERVQHRGITRPGRGSS